MKRLILTTALILAIGTAAHAQFTADTKYISASVTGLNMSYCKSSEFNFGLNAEGGYYFEDAWMARANFGYNHAKTLDGLSLGAGVRYSFLQNGIFIGAGLEYAFDRYTNTTTVLHQVNTTTTVTRPIFDDFGQLVFDDNGAPITETTTVPTTEEYVTVNKVSERVHNLRIPIEIGYTFYLNHYLAVEPAIYSKMSLNHFSEGSEFGLKIGLGFYFDRFHNTKHAHHHNYNHFTF